MNKPLIMIGAGKMAEVLYHQLTEDNRFEIAAFALEKKYYTTDTYLGKPVILYDELARRFPPDRYDAFSSVGYHYLNEARARLHDDVKSQGYHIPTFISKRAYVSPAATIGTGCYVLEGASVQAGAEVGENVAVWNNVTIGHHSRVGNHCWLTAGVTIGGSAMIGSLSFLGLNATIAHDVKIGRQCFIGAGALLTKSAEAGSVFITPSTEKFRLSAKEFLQITQMS